MVDQYYEQQKRILTAKYLVLRSLCNSYNTEHKTDIKPWDCVKFNGKFIFDDHPSFTEPPSNYQFAVGISFKLPIFKKDLTLTKNGYKIVEAGIAGWYDNKGVYYEFESDEILNINEIELNLTLKGKEIEKILRSDNGNLISILRSAMLNGQ